MSGEFFPTHYCKGDVMILFKLHKTVIKRSVVYLVSCAFATFSYWIFNLFIRFRLNLLYLSVIDYADFPEIAISIILFGSSVYFSHQDYLLEKICFVEKGTIFQSYILAHIWCYSILLLNPIVYSFLMSWIEKTDLLFTILAVIRIVIRWLGFMIMTQVFGFWIGLFIKGMYAYLTFVPFVLLFSMYNQFIINLLPLSSYDSLRLSQMLSFNQEFSNALRIEYSGGITTRLHLFKLLLFLTISLILFHSITLFWGKYHHRVIKTLCLIPISGMLLFSLWGYHESFPKAYDPMEKLSSHFGSDAPYHIDSYTGTIRLSETMDAELDVMVSNPVCADDTLVLKLDEAFLIRECFVNGYETKFERDGDYMIFHGLSVDEPVQMHLAYSGRVSYINEIQSLNIFTTSFSAALPPCFAFVPIIDCDDAAHDFLIDIQAKNDIASNLEIFVLENANEYQVSGRAKTFALFEGFLTTTTFHDKKVTYAKYLDEDTFLSEVEMLEQGRQLLDYQTLQPVDIQTQSYSQILNIYNHYYNYNTAVAYDDYVMLNTNNSTRWKG